MRPRVFKRFSRADGPKCFLFGFLLCYDETHISMNYNNRTNKTRNIFVLIRKKKKYRKVNPLICLVRLKLIGTDSENFDVKYLNLTANLRLPSHAKMYFQELLQIHVQSNFSNDTRT